MQPEESFSKIAEAAKQTRELAGDTEVEHVEPKVDETHQLADSLWHGAMQLPMPKPSVVSEEEINEGSKINLKPEESAAKDNAVAKTLAKIRQSQPQPAPVVATAQTVLSKPSQAIQTQKQLTAIKDVVQSIE